jgi:hypothetical protein
MTGKQSSKLGSAIHLSIRRETETKFVPLESEKLCLYSQMSETLKAESERKEKVGI